MRPFRHFFIIVTACCLTLTASGAKTKLSPEALKVKADSAYMHKDYKAAAEHYETLLKEGIDVEALYNLGNAYYRMANLPKAIVCYERCLRYAPSHEDASYNLLACRAKAGIPGEQEGGMFFVVWAKDEIYGHSADEWAVRALIAFAIAGAAWLLSRRLTRRWLRRLLRVLMSLAFVCVLVSIVSAALARYAFTNDRRAVVMKPVDVTDESGRKLPTPLLPGQTVKTGDKNGKSKTAITTLDGKVSGWTDSQSLEAI
ncbi:MAG: tetratricopeptide repeat protein [Alloprevotella sp.]